MINIWISELVGGKIKLRKKMKIKNKYIHLIVLLILFFVAFIKPPEQNILGILTPVSLILFILFLIDFIKSYLLKRKQKDF